MKATDESGKITTPCPVVSVTENEKCLVIFFWIQKNKRKCFPLDFTYLSLYGFVLEVDKRRFLPEIC